MSIISNAINANINPSGNNPVVQGEITYTGEASSKFFDIGIEKREDLSKKTSGVGNDIIDYWDIAQSHFFTVQIYSGSGRNATGLHDINGSPFSFASGKGTYQNYIPIKSMNFNYTTYDNLNIPFGIFGDFPLLHRKKVTSISFTCYDMDDDRIEKALKYWEQQCFPQGKYVAYLDEVKATLKYTSYDVKGKRNFTRVLDVIPAQSVSVSRSYEENGAKMLSFSVVAVGAPGASVVGDDTLKERGYGDGNESANKTYELQVSSVINPSPGYSPTSASYRDAQ